MGGRTAYAIAIALCGIAGGSVPAQVPTATEQPSRTVRVAVFPDPPFSMKESSGRWDGFAAVTLQAAAIPARLVLEFRECASLEELFDAVATGNADIGMGNTLVTSARLSRVAFT